MNHGSLFSGIGGFDLASEWRGWNNLFHCEIDPFCQQVLKYYWSNAMLYDDIKTTDFTIWRGRIDILTGGFPCQPYSQAGKRLGKEDDRHLFPEMLRAIREIQPRWVVGENVRGLTNWNGGLVFDEVQADLEAEGYEVTPFLLPACAVNAPHRRDRIWFVAYRNGLRRTQEYELQRPEVCQQYGERRTTSNPDSDGCYGCDRNDEINTGERGEYAQHDAIQDEGAGDVTNANGIGQIKGCKQPKPIQQGQSCGCYTKADDTNSTIEGLEGLRGEKGGCSKFRTRHNERGGWQGFPTQPPICSGNDGISGRLDGITFPKWRNESIKGYGNAVVPQVVYEIFKAIDQFESLSFPKK